MMANETSEKFSIEIIDSEINAEQVLNSIRSDRAGANILFVGTARSITGEVLTTSLEYECYREMAIHQFERLCHEACQRWPIQGLKIVHRVGPVAIGESSIALAVSTPHRAQAFEASQWLMDSIKKAVPIWKKEHKPDGSSQWIHHGDKPSSPTSQPGALDK